jgi:predicted dinucleotide-binding enzyme
MRIGILGAGMIGATVGSLWHKAGHEVCFGTRHPERTQDLVKRLGAGSRTGWTEEAVRFGDVVLLAIPLGALPELAREMTLLLAGKTVLDAMNPYPQRDGDTAREAVNAGQGSSAWVASQLPGAHVVKAFNTVYFKTLEAEAHKGGDPLGIPLAGDDANAVKTATQLVRDAGFEPVVAGALAKGRQFDPGTPAYNSGMRASALRRALGVA